MKQSFFKYCFLLIVLFFAAYNSFSTLHKVEKSNHLKNIYTSENSKSAAIQNNLQNTTTYLRSGKIQHTFVQHYKADFHENEFEVQNSSKIQRIKALFKAIVLFFATHLSVHYHSTKSTTVLAALTTFFSYLKSKSFLSLRVIRL